MRRIMRFLSALLLVLAAAGPGQAVPLTNLINGQTLTVGDKLFDNWVVFFEGTVQVDLANIDVTGIDDAFNPGLMFNLGREFEVAGQDFISLDLFFNVSVLDPGMLMTGMSSALHSFSVHDGELSVVERAATNFGDLGSIFLGGEFSTTFGDLVFGDFQPDPQRQIIVRTFIRLHDGESITALGSFSQRFTQTRAVVPEPGTAVLLGSGLLVAMLVRRKKT